MSNTPEQSPLAMIGVFQSVGTKALHQQVCPILCSPLIGSRRKNSRLSNGCLAENAGVGSLPVGSNQSYRLYGMLPSGHVRAQLVGQAGLLATQQTFSTHALLLSNPQDEFPGVPGTTKLRLLPKHVEMS
ncbi:MAG: hypothetical protein DWH91_15030 [Planctomycetota bacterium]|nr:MAG: hypothetical protein DWH91_15030 [Planctomycetota bacterium]